MVLYIKVITGLIFLYNNFIIWKTMVAFGYLSCIVDSIYALLKNMFLKSLYYHIVNLSLYTSFMGISFVHVVFIAKHLSKRATICRDKKYHIT